jgi:hypothetical protein
VSSPGSTWTSPPSRRRTASSRARTVEAELSSGFSRGQAAELVGKVGELRFFRRFLDEVSAIEDELAA